MKSMLRKFFIDGATAEKLMQARGLREERRVNPEEVLRSPAA
jgi:hypothetical protein